MTTTTLPTTERLECLAGQGKLAQLAEKPKPGRTVDSFDTENFVAEPKLDGWRILIHRHDDGVAIWTRNGKRHDGSLPTIEAEIMENLPPGTWIDCEAVALTVVDGKVQAAWASVQSVLGSTTGKAAAQEDKITLMAFDLLAHGGIDATGLPFGQRRQLLEQVFAGGEWTRVMLVPQIRPTTKGFDALLAQSFEGMMIKDRRARYAPGKRGCGLTKVKLEQEMDAIITGFTEGKNGFAGMVGAMTFAAYDAEGNLQEIGKCSGMTLDTRIDMTKNPAKYLGKVAEITYLERHPSGGFRNPNFKRLRTDKAATDCTLEAIG
jgi:ATP-dependent DNA ligase